MMEMLEVGTSVAVGSWCFLYSYMKNLAKPELKVANLRKIQGGRDTGSVHESAESGGGTDRYALVQPIPEIQIYRASGYGSWRVMEGEGRHSRGQCAFRNDPSDLDFDMIEEANDYYFPAWTALYLKFTRVLILLLTVFMTPVFIPSDAESAVDSAGTRLFRCGMS
ncbi:MAG: hypothetical protein ACLTSZ_16415 [Lachnospiraceae bacterium]